MIRSPNQIATGGYDDRDSSFQIHQVELLGWTRCAVTGMTAIINVVSITRDGEHIVCEGG
jgi:hypothetical protein